MEGKLGMDRSEAMMWFRHDKDVTGSMVVVPFGVKELIKIRKLNDES